MFVDNGVVESALAELERLEPGVDWTFADAGYIDDDAPGETFELGFKLAVKAAGRDIITATTPGGKVFFFIGTEQEVIDRITEAWLKAEKNRRSSSKSRIPLRR